MAESNFRADLHARLIDGELHLPVPALSKVLYKLAVEYAHLGNREAAVTVLKIAEAVDFAALAALNGGTDA